jgi:hypothetical protein
MTVAFQFWFSGHDVLDRLDEVIGLVTLMAVIIWRIDCRNVPVHEAQTSIREIQLHYLSMLMPGWQSRYFVYHAFSG